MVRHRFLVPACKGSNPFTPLRSHYELVARIKTVMSNPIILNIEPSKPVGCHAHDKCGIGNTFVAVEIIVSNLMDTANGHSPT